MVDLVINLTLGSKGFAILVSRSLDSPWIKLPRFRVPRFGRESQVFGKMLPILFPGRPVPPIANRLILLRPRQCLVPNGLRQQRLELGPSLRRLTHTAAGNPAQSLADRFLAQKPRPVLQIVLAPTVSVFVGGFQQRIRRPMDVELFTLAFELSNLLPRPFCQRSQRTIEFVAFSCRLRTLLPVRPLADGLDNLPQGKSGSLVYQSVAISPAV